VAETNRPERVLILGGAGMLGHKLVQTFAAEFDTWTTVRGSGPSYAPYGLIHPDRVIEGIDALNFDSLAEVIERLRPQAVVNCIGIIKQLPTASDPVLNLTINSLLPHRLQQLCHALGARLIHFSTDCVFSGRKGNYTEDDPSDALDLYGRTKFLGETSGEGALTIRSSVIGRELSTTSGLVEWFLAQRGGVVHGYTRAIYSGFTTQMMARIVSSLLLDHPALCGPVQVSSAPISKYELLGLLREAYDVAVDIVPDETVQMDRTLDSSRFRALTAFVPPSWPDMIGQMASDATPYEQWRASRREATR
jgi:dTDP-4-dehydrorhamnose reductase